VKQALFNLMQSYLVSRSIKGQAKTGLPDVGHWGLGVNDKGHLAVNQFDVLDLVAGYGSPLLVVNRRQLLRDAASIQQAVKRIGEKSKVVYSYKTNCIPGILKEIHGVGIGAEVVSPYELWLAEQLKVPAEEIVYNGVNKTEESLVRAIDMGILAINVDSLPEIERLVAVARRLKKKARIGIRLGFIGKSQFGLDIESGEAMEACSRISRHSDCLELDTVHFCVTSNVKESGTHRHFAQKSLEFIHALKAQEGTVIRHLDLGGGIGVPTSKNMDGFEYGLYRLFGCLPKAPDPAAFEEIDTFVQRIGEAVRDSCNGLNLEMPAIILEPGRFVTSRCEFLLSTVLAIKEKSRGPTFAITDAGRLSLTFPCDFEYHSIFLADQGKSRLKKEPYHVMGRICTSADWMAKNICLPQLREGDVLATMDAGAYFSSYSSNFAFPRPAIVMVSEQGRVEVLRRAESFEHLVALDTVE
jgi:diaminopimelate decarboxylase